MNDSQFDQSNNMTVKTNDIEKTITNESQTVEGNDKDSNMKSVKIKKCETCGEKFIGTEKVIKEKLYQHVKSKHLSGVTMEVSKKSVENKDIPSSNSTPKPATPNSVRNNPQRIATPLPATPKPNRSITQRVTNPMPAMPNSAKINSQSQENLQKKKTTYRKKCEICHQMIFGTAEILDKHINSCKVYGKLFKQTSNGFDCLQCSEKQMAREKILLHIRAKHLKKVQVTCITYSTLRFLLKVPSRRK